MKSFIDIEIAQDSKDFTHAGEELMGWCDTGTFIIFCTIAKSKLYQ